MRQGNAVEQRIRDGTYDFSKIEESIQKNGEVVQPILLTAFTSSDEHHRKCKLDNASEIEVRVARDANGKPMSIADGGGIFCIHMCVMYVCI